MNRYGITPKSVLEAGRVSHAQNERHVFRADPRNALRVKEHDCFGRWVYADTLTTYNLSESGYTKLVEAHRAAGTLPAHLA
jgi:hypothetical protein